MKFNVICFICLFICACNHIHEGYIIEKQDIPEYISHDLKPIIVGKSILYIPVNHFHPETWSVKIMKLHTHSRKFDYNIFWVSKQQFDSIQINQYIKFK